MTLLPSSLDAISFTSQKNERIKIRPVYYELGFSPYPTMYGRRIIWEKLEKAIDLLPRKYGLQIWDVYRPREVQKRLFKWMCEEIKKKLPKASDQEIFSEAKKFMSPASNVGEVNLPPKYC